MCGANLMNVRLPLRVCPQGGHVVRGRRTEGHGGSARRGGVERLGKRHRHERAMCTMAATMPMSMTRPQR